MSTERRKPYPFDQIEPKWQGLWDKEQTFHVLNPGEPGFNPARPKYYVLDMFPYPSGSGLHVGHPEGYTATDIIGRYKRMRGYNVLHPMGWDAFGLPAEQYAIKTGKHPRATTEENIVKFKKQLQRIGFAYDWQREVNTTDPGYFKWTQWIFLQIYHSWFNPATNRAESIETLKAAFPEKYEAAEKAEWRRFEDTHRLAYVSEALVNWCPGLGTVLANEEVIDGKSEVGGFPVERRPMRQWMLRITKYAERLIRELDGLDWPDSIKLHQRNWIGRSDGAEVDFTVAGSPGSRIRVFTTRPDTLYGATYMVLAPEHAMVDTLVTDEQRDDVRAYRESASRKSDLERTELAKDKTGVFTGAHAVNPVNGQQIPIWIADYVIMGYGTGAIMAVPAHDERDWTFAVKYGLPIRDVVSASPTLSLGGGSAPCEAPPLECMPGEGYAIHSGPLDGLPTADAKREITRLLEAKELGKGTINYKLRDWLFSRQRYWGEPFPVIWEAGDHRCVTEAELPVRPPEMEDFKPTGTPEPPLSKATDWVKYSDAATRETNTMPQWAGSCWYYLRYCDPRNSERFVGKDAESYWMTGEPQQEILHLGKVHGLPQSSEKIVYADRGPLLSESKEEGVEAEIATAKVMNHGGVDLYVGGTEHAVLHLLYARFWHKVLYDLGHVSTPEPFQKLVNQGLILGEMEYSLFEYSDGRPCSAAEVRGIEEEATESGARMVATHKESGERLHARRVPAEEVEKAGTAFALRSDRSIQVDARTFKMSKSRGNVVNPDDVIDQYGADSLRCYEMFMGPLKDTKPWSMTGVEGVSRFLARVWRLVMEENQAGEWHLAAAVQDLAPDKALLKVMHATIKKVGEDIEELAFNTAIPEMMKLTTALTGLNPRPRPAIGILLQLLNPFAPHLTEELWERAGFAAEFGPLVDVPWPEFNDSFLVEDEIEVVLQINGKVRDKLVIQKDASKEDVEAAALASSKIQEWTAGATIKKIIVVPGKLVNIVVG